MRFKHGEPISDKLATALKEHISIFDREELAEDGLSASTLRSLMYQIRPVTQKNEKGVIKLVKRALENCNKTRSKFIRQEKTMKNYDLKDSNYTRKADNI